MFNHAFMYGRVFMYDRVFMYGRVFMFGGAFLLDHAFTFARAFMFTTIADNIYVKPSEEFQYIVKTFLFDFRRLWQRLIARTYYVFFAHRHMRTPFASWTVSPTMLIRRCQ